VVPSVIGLRANSTMTTQCAHRTSPHPSRRCSAQLRTSQRGGGPGSHAVAMPSPPHEAQLLPYRFRSQSPTLGTRGNISGPDPQATGPHTVLQWDGDRIYQAREYGKNGVPIRDIDFTHPTFPNGKLRPDHTAPEQHPWTPNDPNSPKAGYQRAKTGKPL